MDTNERRKGDLGVQNSSQLSKNSLQLIEGRVIPNILDCLHMSVEILHTTQQSGRKEGGGGRGGGGGGGGGGNGGGGE